MTAIATNNGVALDGLFAELRTRFQAWSVRRETRKALNQLSERQLEDIGMCRADIDTVVGTL
ncbi:DUF1127 domain-containing protein [Paracoccus tegillarcae]|uniref:YjiS-like domain-containing protein n=1 Tax=Paracoccus tegillarcae TaxID=1529068 RepID=A0A2K9EWF1_9RHOB|nr:DUF1127 domain-containing protein [Paracoccus tegillarcae]AUH33604.1 hypothetical protein CUV01_09585 [Paracoccus tegillarcae]